ncbi:MAG TPA: hypothetical protein VFH39_04490, partial [Candidatus Saccharimonadales bacterium]|nr:hypothetical protein [Candidatus Saccharimonadales bacterium]
MRVRSGCVFAASLVLLLAAVIGMTQVRTDAATNGTLNFQAKLMTSSGSIAADGNYNVEFNLYSQSSGGTSLWTEDHLNSAGTQLRVVNGYLTVNLGSVNPFPSTINWDQDLWLGMTVRGTGSCAFSACTPADAEMTPRLKLTATPYAFSAGKLSQYNSSTLFTSTLQLQAPTGGNQIFQVQDQGAAGTYNLLTQNQANGSYIQNQTGTAQQANFYIQSASAGSVGAIIQGATGQTADLFEAKDSTGNIRFNIFSGSGVGINTNGSRLNNAVVSVAGNGTTTPEIALRAAGGQTVDILTALDSANDVLSGINFGGGFYSNGATNTFNALQPPAFTTASTGTAYYYEIAATNASGETMPSSSLGMANNTSTLQWSQVPGATGYKIYRNTTNSFGSGSLLLTTITNGATTSYTDTGSATGTGLPRTSPSTGNPLTVNGYTGFGLSVNSYGNTSVTNSLSVSGLGGCYGVNTTLCVKSSATNAGQIVQGSTGQTADLVQYQGSNGVTMSGVDANGQFYGYGTNLTINNLAVPTLSVTTAGTTYYYVVTAVNNNGVETTPSNEVGATNSTTITWPSVAGATHYYVYRGTTPGGENLYFNNTSCSSGTCSFSTATSFSGSRTPPTTTTGSGLTIQGWANQTGTLFNFTNSAGASVYRITAVGDFISNSMNNTVSGLIVGGGYTTHSTNKLQVQTNGAVIGQVIQAGASQSADLLELQDSNGNPTTSFDKNGYIHINRATASTDTIFTGRVSGDTNDRVQIQANGQINFGPGNAAT